MDKKALREIYKELRNKISPSQKSKLEDLILIQFQRLDIVIPIAIMTYAPLEKMNEFDPFLITEYCFFKCPNQRLAYPKISEEYSYMRAIEVDEQTLFKKNKFGIPEPINDNEKSPNEIELVIIPLLAYDVKGNRVGHGKGYYDRFLSECRKDVIKIGFSFFEPEPEIFGVGEQDISLDYCISPKMIYVF
jgi:5-formyltetrahydrofolate cyclo-ligase